MPMTLLGNGTLVVDDELRQEAGTLVHQAFDMQLDGLFVRINGKTVAIPSRLSELLVQIIERTAEGGATSIERLPEELTTTVAAELLGISRPTLMRLIDAGEIPSKKVGTHTRLLTTEVLRLKRSRAALRQLAFDRLRETEDELNEV